MRRRPARARRHRGLSIRRAGPGRLHRTRFEYRRHHRRDATPPAASQVSWIDRHPLFYKPREYFDSSGNNTIVKTASATFIGIPVGLVGEVRQVLTGSPNGTKY